MTGIACSALRGDDTLGFLAALGVLEVLTASGRTGATLTWSDGGEAVIEAGLDLLEPEDLAAALHEQAESMHSEGRVAAAPDAKLITEVLPAAQRRAQKVAGIAEAYDPMRLTDEQARQAYQRVQEAELSQSPGAPLTARWLVALINPAQAQHKRTTRALTPLYSPSGAMTLHQLLDEHLRAVVQRPERLHQALTNWRREPGSGANLDTRALRDAAVASSGKADNAAVLGASWLALQGIAAFRQVSGSSPSAVGWARTRSGVQLQWPTWRPALNPTSVASLLSHPTVVRAALVGPGDSLDGRSQVRERHLRDELSALGVREVYVTGRRTLGKSAGALRPPRLAFSAG